MADGTNVSPSPEELEALMNDITKDSAPAADLAQSGAFSGDSNAPAAGDGTTTTVSTGLSDSVRAHLNAQQKTDASLLHIFNFNNAELMGWIVGEEARIEPTLRGVPLELGGAKQLEDGAPEPVREKFATTGNAPLAHLKKVFEIAWRQTTPGKTEAMIVRMPVGGLVDYMKFREPGQVKFDSSNRTLITQVIPFKAAFTFLNNYLRNGVKESVETHGPLASIVKPDVTTKNVLEANGLVTTKVRRKIVAVGRKTLVVPGNHLPIRTYEKVLLSDRLSAEEISKLNISAFYNLSQAKYGNRGDKLQHLHENYVGKLTVGQEDGMPVIESSYITADVSRRERPVVKPYFGDKNSVLDEIYLPVKRLEPNKAGELKARYVKYSAVDKNVLENPELRAKTSLELPEYADFIKAVGEDILNVDTLRGLTKERRTSKKIGTDIVAQLELSIAEGTLNDPTVEFDQTPEELNEINKTLYSITQSVLA